MDNVLPYVSFNVQRFSISSNINGFGFGDAREGVARAFFYVVINNI